MGCRWAGRHRDSTVCLPAMPAPGRRGGQRLSTKASRGGWRDRRQNGLFARDAAALGAAGAAQCRRNAQRLRLVCARLPRRSIYHEHKARQADFLRTPPCAQRDAALRVEIKRVFDADFRVYGVCKAWRQFRRGGVDVARCTVARLMKDMELAGAVRGKTARTTISSKAAPCRLDRVSRQFRAPAPNMPRVADFTYVATSAFHAAKAPGSGFAYVAFVVEPKGSPDIGAFARRIVSSGEPLSPRRLRAGRAGAGAV